MSEQTQQERLEAEFPAAMLGSVTKGGAKLTYVPVSEVIQRLNDVLGMTAWSWEATRVWRDEVSPDWVLAVGRMTATIDGVTSTKSGEGGVKVKYLRDGETLVDLGDEFKGAASDALKKAAQKFGVALYLSRKDGARRYEEPAPTRDAIEEGWLNAADQRDAAARLADDIKAAGEDVAQAMREFRDRMGVIWPPTRDEHDKLRTELARIAPQPPERPAERPEEPTAPEAAAEPAAAPEPPDPEVVRRAEIEEFVKSLSSVELLVEFGKHNWTAPRKIGEQRAALVELMVANPGSELA